MVQLTLHVIKALVNVFTRMCLYNILYHILYIYNHIHIYIYIYIIHLWIYVCIICISKSKHVEHDISQTLPQQLQAQHPLFLQDLFHLTGSSTPNNGLWRRSLKDYTQRFQTKVQVHLEGSPRGWIGGRW